MTGIVLTPLVPMRTLPAETGEMCSQLLFGECVEVLETQERWLHVCNRADGYTGWVDRKMIESLTPADEAATRQTCRRPLQTPVCTARLDGEPLLLPGGSLVHTLDGKPWLPGGRKLSVDESALHIAPLPAAERLAASARLYLHAPYLWGGKSPLGIDCSGLVQVACSMNGVTLPRDASLQVERGETVSFLAEARRGDLAFFDNDEGRIVHVGILLDAGHIIHASGQVKEERIDTQGIISSRTGEYTHRLRIIKRIFRN